MGSIETKELLWCSLCSKKFSLSDIDTGRYFPETGICISCYSRMAKEVSGCFGKVEKYDRETKECSTFCPDRKICKDFISGITVPKRERSG
jgi:hypothetical protein